MSSAADDSPGPAARIGVVGAGRMGQALTARLGSGHAVTVVSRHARRFTTADGRDVPVGDDPSALTGCAVVLLAVPAHEMPAALDWVRPHVPSGAVTLNLATELATSELDGTGLRLIGCKIIGQSGQIARGLPAALVVDGATEAERAGLAELLRPVGVVLDAPESLVAKVNDLVARRVIVAERGLARELDELGLPVAAQDAATGNLAAGIWQAVASGNTGPYLTRLIAELAKLA